MDSVFLPRVLFCSYALNVGVVRERPVHIAYSVDAYIMKSRCHTSTAHQMHYVFYGSNWMLIATKKNLTL